VKKYGTHTLGQVPSLPNGAEVLIGALVAKVTKKVSKKSGEPFWIALVEDLEGSLEIYVNPELHEAAKDSLAEEKMVFLKGFVRFRTPPPPSASRRSSPSRRSPPGSPLTSAW